jgi:hypothetical protein
MLKHDAGAVLSIARENFLDTGQRFDGTGGKRLLSEGSPL